MSRSELVSAVLLALGLLSPAHAWAALPWAPSGNVLNWSNETVAIDSVDCEKQGISGIIVTGNVILVHPQANTSTAQTIRLTCPYIIFKSNSQLLSREALNIKITKQISGSVTIINTRGQVGDPAKSSPEIWKAWHQPQADTGATGDNGRNAETDLKGDWAADDGQPGKTGQHGATGANGASGNPGGAGASAARLQLRVASFADNTVVVMHAIGGDGGPGGKGGRGQDGGKGGTGGTGGKGGDGNGAHNGKSGGNGGNGGDGGNGGNGGTGGPGGPGGNGADVALFIMEGGGSPADLELVADGGYGGGGGEGGDYGLGGDGGDPGAAGCGGGGGTFIWKTGGGSCGTNGLPGRPGQHGDKGPPGASGEHGHPGNILNVTLQYVPPTSF